MKRVLLDCDGVLADFVGGWLKMMNAYWGTNYEREQVTGWDVCASLGLSDQQRAEAERLIGNCEFANRLEVYPGAQAAVRQLRAIADVYIITSPWASCSTWAFDRARWLERNFNISRAHIISTEAKYMCFGDLLVDDKPETCIEWQKAWPRSRAVLWKTPNNLTTRAMISSEVPIFESSSWADVELLAR